MAKRLALLAVLAVLVGGCSKSSKPEATASTTDEDRKEAIYMCQTLRNVEAETVKNDEYIAQQLRALDRWAADIEAWGIYFADRETHRINAQKMQEAVMRIGGTPMGTRSIFKDMKLKGAFSQIQRDSVVKGMDERFTLLDKISDNLTIAQSQIMNSRPEGALPASAPSSIRTIRSMIASAAQRKPVVSDALRGLRMKYAITDQERP